MNNKRIFITLIATLTLSSLFADTPLKDRWAHDFLIGVAVNARQAHTENAAEDSVISRHFNSLVPENAMKSEVIHPQQGIWNWTEADQFVDYATSKGAATIGHTLIWHSQLAPWFCKDSLGNLVSPDTLRARMKDHISTILHRYKGKIKGYDVVNEAIVEDGSFRHSPFFQILGWEYIPLAFQYAHEADPDAELYLNDYGQDNPARRASYLALIDSLQARGLRLDGIGMQTHIGMDYPLLDEYEKSLHAYASKGLKVMVTEMDLSALPTISRSADVAYTTEFKAKYDPYPNGLPDAVAAQWRSRIEAVLAILLRNAQYVDRVTFWGLSDADSWKNDYPMKGRTDYPLLFDRNLNIKIFNP